MTDIDVQTLNSLRDATGADFLSELMNTFFEDTPIQFENMKNALAAGDAEAFRRAAHSLKSNAATFGAVKFSALARELEMMGRDNNLEVGDKLQALQEAFVQTREQLNGLR